MSFFHKKKSRKKLRLKQTTIYNSSVQPATKNAANFFLNSVEIFKLDF